MSGPTDPRVLFAGERTLLAWNRSSLALIAFGFVVERSGLLLSMLALPDTNAVNSPLILAVGLAFIMLGLFAAIYSARQFLLFIRTLDASEFPRGYTVYGGIVLNAVVALLGAVLAGILYFNRLDVP